MLHPPSRRFLARFIHSRSKYSGRQNKYGIIRLVDALTSVYPLHCAAALYRQYDPAENVRFVARSVLISFIFKCVFCIAVLGYVRSCIACWPPGRSYNEDRHGDCGLKKAQTELWAVINNSLRFIVVFFLLAVTQFDTEL